MLGVLTLYVSDSVVGSVGILWVGAIGEETIASRLDWTPKAIVSSRSSTDGSFRGVR